MPMRALTLLVTSIDPCNRLKNEVTLETAVRVRIGGVGTVTC
jgi:hypothetical protein